MNFNDITEDAKQYVKAIIECIDDGIWITDGQGNVIEVNTQALGCQKREDIIGKNMKDLVEAGIYDTSVTLKVLKEKKKATIVQHEETEMIVTGIPYIENGKIQMVVSCEREVKELEIMKEQLQLNKEKLDRYESELAYLRSVMAKEVDVVLESKEMKQVVELAVTAAKYGSRVLIEGETGVGKEIIAKIIYRNGNRNNAPFIAVNCGAIPENLLESELFGYEKGAFTGADRNGKMGLFEMANHGTLFLDEIGDLPIHMQSKLLRAIQEREIMRVGGDRAISVDIRLISATNQDLKAAVAKGTFRGDLYYRLNVMPIELAPLKGRKKDIKALANYFVKAFNKDYKLNKTISDEAIKVLQKFDWPGNIRELENIMERIMISFDGEVITNLRLREL